jgi:hypothetical protein
MYQPIIDRSYLFECNLGTLGLQKKINFVYNANVEKVGTYALETFCVDQVAKSPSQNDIVTNLGLASLLVTLVVGDDEQIFSFPATDFNPQRNNGIIRMLDNKVINIPKSYLTIISLTNLSDNQSLMLNFIFNRKERA